MADHSDFLEMAREMIAEDGRAVTFYQLSAVAADPAKPWQGQGTPTLLNPAPTFAVFLSHFGEFDLGKNVFDKELFKNSEQLLLVAPPISGEALEDYHIVVDGGVRWKIDIARVLKPGPIVVLIAMGVSR